MCQTRYRLTLYKINKNESFKIIEYLFIFYLSLLAIGQSNYNTTSGVFTFNYHPCLDACVIANADDCSKWRNQEVCLKRCEELGLSDKDYLYCRNKCRITEDQIRVNKRREGFIARVQFTQNTSTPSSYKTYDINNGIASNGGWFLIPSSDPSFSVQAPIYSPNSYYCYRYIVVIRYDDGSQCVSNESGWICSL